MREGTRRHLEHLARGALVAALGVFGAFTLACASGEGEDDTGGNTEVGGTGTPTLAAEDRTVVLRPGEQVTHTWTVTWAEGQRPDDVLLQVFPMRYSDTFGGAWWSDFDHGETWTLTFTAGEPRLYPPVQPVATLSQAASTGDVAIEGALRIQVIGGPADVVVPPVGEVVLGVGEVRPLTAFVGQALEPYEANPNPSFGQRLWSHEALTFDIEDPSVATVDAQGVLVARAEGDTTLTLSAGEASVEVPVRVDDTPLDGPPPGAVPVLDHHLEPYNVTWRTVDGPLETKVALDDRGWPMLVATAKPGLGPDVAERFQAIPEPVLLARWTGTGFGFEYLPVPPLLHHPVVATDAAGHLYLVLQDAREHVLEVWDRPGDVATGGWTRRRLPLGVDGGDLASWGLGSAGYVPAAVLSRDAGGIWLAWSYPHAWSGDEGACPVVTRVAALTPDTLEVEDVSAVWVSADAGSAQDCPALFEARSLPVRMALLPPEGDEAFPTVVTLGLVVDDDPGALVFWRWTQGGWVGEPEPNDQPASDLPWDDIAPAVPVQGPDDLVLVEGTGVGIYAWRGPGDGEPLVATTAPEYGQEENPAWDDDPLAGDATGWRAYLGHASDTERLYRFGLAGEGAFDGYVRLHTSRLPRPATAADPESEGRRLVRPTGAAFFPEHLDTWSDGGRVLRSATTLAASDAPDGAWTWEEPFGVGGLYLAGNVQSFLYDDVYHLVSGRKDTTGAWPVHTWDGTAWQTVRHIDLGHEIEVSAPDGGGGLWVLARDGGGAWLPPDPDDPVVSIAAGTVRTPNAADGAVPSADGGLVFVASAAASWTVYDLAADGSLAWQQTFEGEALPERVVRTAAGRLLMPAPPTWDQPSTQALWASDDDGDSWTRIDLGDAGWSEYPHLLALPDGRVGMVGTRTHGWFGHQAALVTSDDGGATWSAPTWVRPDGGTVQRVGAVGLDADGDVLVVVQDLPTWVIPRPEDYVPRLWLAIDADVLVEVTP